MLHAKCNYFLDRRISRRYTTKDSDILLDKKTFGRFLCLSRPPLDRALPFSGISWYAILITGAIVIGYLLASGEARRLHLPPQDTVIDFLLYAIPLGLICARLYYVAFRFNDYSEDLLSVFNIREGGMAIYGGVIGGLIAARLVSRKHKISMLTLLDVVAPALCARSGHRPLGQLHQYGSSWPAYR